MEAPARDYYEVLGVARGADAATVKRAFRARARRFHPDVSDDPEAESRFRELAEAYSVLSRPASRLLYDRLGYRGRTWAASPAAAQALVGLLELWARARRRPRHSGTVAEVDLGFYEAARGARRKIRYRASGPCSACGGSGAADGGVVETCGACAGRGTIRQTDDSGDVVLLQLARCELCAGSGRLVSRPCAECGGGREMQHDREVELSIPSGAEDGERLPVTGEEGAFVLLRVAAQPVDSRLVRAAAAFALVAAVAFVVFVFAG
ncbi:MAG: DnaJ domain-containing protein [Gaiellaceae bacterium]